MADEPTEGQPRGLPEGLRIAIERTFAATTGSAAETRGRAQELLDEVSRRGQEAREAMARRGQEAAEASATATARLIETIQDMRLATKEDFKELRAELRALAKRVASLEKAGGKKGQSADEKRQGATTSKGTGAKKKSSGSQPKVES